MARQGSVAVWGTGRNPYKALAPGHRPRRIRCGGTPLSPPFHPPFDPPQRNRGGGGMKATGRPCAQDEQAIRRADEGGVSRDRGRGLPMCSPPKPWEHGAVGLGR